MTTPLQEDPNSYELGANHYRGYRDLNPNPNNPAQSARNHHHNAFGEDSDSEEYHETENQQENLEFDVYKDFNNSGIRYATLLNQNKDANASGEDLNQSMRLTNQPSAIKSISLDSEKPDAADYPFNYSITSPTTPKAAKKSKLNLKSNLKNPKSRWRIGSIVAFISAACVGIAIFFLMPRQPFISFEKPITINQIEGSNNNNNNSKAFQARDPTDFSFDSQVSLTLDGRASYLPTLIRDFRIMINDLGSTTNSVRIASGMVKGFTASPSKLTSINLNVTFEYNAKNSSDTLWQNWRKACGNIDQSKINGTITRPSLQLDIILSFNVIGMIGTKSDSTQLNNVACPIQLPTNAPFF